MFVNWNLDFIISYLLWSQTRSFLIIIVPQVFLYIQFGKRKPRSTGIEWDTSASELCWWRRTSLRNNWIQINNETFLNAESIIFLKYRIYRRMETEHNDTNRSNAIPQATYCWESDILFKISMFERGETFWAKVKSFSLNVAFLSCLKTNILLCTSINLLLWGCFCFFQRDMQRGWVLN
jgi:hypothetical protein